jgi:Ca-activated chloride channel homolog
MGAERFALGGTAVIEPTLFQLRVIAAVFVLLLLVAITFFVLRRRRVARALGDSILIRHLLGTDLAALPWSRLVPVVLGAIALGGALLDPSLAATRSTVNGPVILLLDASGSMLVDDVGRPRLEAQRGVARALVSALPDLPVGIVAFAGRAFSLTPPTRDRGSLDMYLAALDPTMVTQSGSALGAAIRQGLGLLSASGTIAGGTIVLMGDGDETEDSEAALDAAELARRAGVTIHTVGIGSVEGAGVPALNMSTGVSEGYLQDLGGSTLVSRLNEDFLRSISRAGGGTYVLASQPDALPRLRDAIRATPNPAETPAGAFPRYAWLATAALILLVIEPIADRSRRRQ